MPCSAVVSSPVVHVVSLLRGVENVVQTSCALPLRFRPADDIFLSFCRLETTGLPDSAGLAREAFLPVGTLARITKFERPQPGLMMIGCVGSTRLPIDRGAAQAKGRPGQGGPRTHTLPLVDAGARNLAAFEALQDAWRGRKVTMTELSHFARINRVERVMQPYLEAVTQ